METSFCNKILYLDNIVEYRHVSVLPTLTWPVKDRDSILFMLEDYFKHKLHIAISLAGIGHILGEYKCKRLKYTIIDLTGMVECVDVLEYILLKNTNYSYLLDYVSYNNTGIIILDKLNNYYNGVSHEDR